MKCKVFILINVFFFSMIQWNIAQEYDQGSGSTTYPQKDGGVVVYGPTSTGSTVTVCDKDLDCEETECTKNPKKCKDLIEEADKGKTQTSMGSGGNKVQLEPVLMTEIRKMRELHPSATMFAQNRSGKLELVKEPIKAHKKILSRLK